MYVTPHNYLTFLALPSDEVILENGATCNASSELRSRNDCTKVIDGSTTHWFTNQELAGAWIWIQLDQTYYLSRIDLRGICDLSKKPEIVRIRFSDESIQTVYIYIYIHIKEYIIGFLF